MATSKKTANNVKPPTTFNALLLRLVLLCALPMLLLAIVLAITYVLEMHARSEREAIRVGQNFASALDHNIRARISALQLLGASPPFSEPPQLDAIYRQAAGFRTSFGGEVVLADGSMQMLLNTRAAFGSPLGKLPKSKGFAAAPAALASGEAAVGDIVRSFDGKDSVVAVVAPILREGKPPLLLLNVIPTANFQQRLDRLSLPTDWSLMVIDSSSNVIARAPEGAARHTSDNDTSERFETRLETARWSVVLQIPRSVYFQPVFLATATVLALIIITTLVSLLAGRLFGGRIARAVATLTDPLSATPENLPQIREIEGIRQSLIEASQFRLLAQAALRDSEARYREMFESNPHPMWTYDLETLAFLSVNDAAVAQYGFSREEFLAMTIRDIRPAEDIPHLLDELTRVQPGLIGAKIWRHCRKDGSSMLVETTAHSLVFGDRPARLVLAHDVTAREVAAEQLRASEENLSITLQSIGDAVIATDASGRITRMNATAERMTACTLADAIGRPLSEIFRIVNATTRLPSANPVELVMAHGETVGLANHTVLLALDGREYQIADSAAPIRNAAGYIVGVVLVFSDVTDTYSIRQALASTAELLERTGTMAKVGGWELDVATMTPYWSGETCRIHEVDPPVAPPLAEAIRFYSPEARATIEAAVQAAVNDGTPWDLELPFITAKGRHIWVRTQCSTVMKDGKVTRLLGAFHDITERKHAEAALQESERRYRTIVEWSPEPMIVYRDGNVVYANPSAVRMIGAESIEQVIGKSLLDLVHADSHPLLLKRMKFMNDGEPGTPLAEMRAVKLDGTVIDVEVQSAAIVYDNLPAIQVTIRDITARKLAEMVLRESEALNFAILDSVASEIAVLDQDGTIIAVNEPWRRFALENGIEPGIAASHTDVGTNYLSVCSTSTDYAVDEDAANARAGIQAVLEGRLAYFAMEYPCHSPRLQRWFTLNVTPLGKTGGVVVAHTNITERKQAEAARIAIINASMDAIITVDEHERVMVFSVAAEKMFQLPAEDAIGQTIDRFIPARLRTAHHEHIARLRQSGSVTRPMGQFARLTALHTDGTEFPIEASISKIEVGGKSLFTVTIRDVTERERAEAVRSSLEAQLRESQKMEAIGTLAGGIAHDFNNILASIIGNTELARQDLGANPSAQESLDEIQKASKRASALVQQILSFSRRQATELKLIALAAVVDESARLLRATLPPRLTLAVHCDIDVPPVLADATQIEQIIVNLVTNAMHAMRGGKGLISIQLDTIVLDRTFVEEHPSLTAMIAARPGRTVRLRVSDDGQGMDAATLSRIFEPFFTTKPVDEGTGLGLSVVHGIIVTHEGAIEVNSQLDKGSTFTVYLPVAKAEDVAENAGPRMEGAPAVPVALMAAGRQHILYIDDDESLVFLIQRLLERRGFRISGFSDQHEALDALRANPADFDLVVSDYNMPGLSGLDVAREVKSIRADLPVAVASGFIDETLREQADGAGVCELIFKANAVEDLCDAFSRLAQSVSRK